MKYLKIELNPSEKLMTAILFAFVIAGFFVPYKIIL